MKNKISKKSINVAILGGSTTDLIKKTLSKLMLANKIKVNIYESNYNQFYFEAINISKKLKSFNPDIIYIHITNKNIEPNKENKKTSSKTKPTTLAFIVFIFYLVLLPILGFIIATIPFFATMMVLFSEKRVLHIVVGSVSFTTFFYILFRHGFNIFLPIGEWQNLIATLSS